MPYKSFHASKRTSTCVASPAVATRRATVRPTTTPPLASAPSDNRSHHRPRRPAAPILRPPLRRPGRCHPCCRPVQRPGLRRQPQLPHRHRPEEDRPRKRSGARQRPTVWPGPTRLDRAFEANTGAWWTDRRPGSTCRRESESGLPGGVPSRREGSFPRGERKGAWLPPAPRPGHDPARRRCARPQGRASPLGAESHLAGRIPRPDLSSSCRSPLRTPARGCSPRARPTTAWNPWCWSPRPPRRWPRRRSCRFLCRRARR